MEQFTAKELRKLRSLKDPYGIAKLLNDMPYHLATSAWSPRRVLAEGTAHCLEGAIFGAAALRANGYPPLILDLEAERDTDHVIAVYRDRDGWGAVGKSNYAFLAYREPVYRTLRELAMSYFEQYFNLAGERTLRGHGRPLNLARFDGSRWMTSTEDLWPIARHLERIPHVALVPPAAAHRLTRLGPRLRAAGLLGHPTAGPRRRG